MASSPLRPRYDEARLEKYFNHIHLPANKVSKSHKNSEPALVELRTIQQYHLVTVPFENLSLHYSPHHSLNLNPDFLYDKIVNKGHGGYCMEQNCFFGTMLHSLGFNIYSAGARVYEGSGVYTSWSHMVNIVTLANGERYLVDVGFGNNGPTCPLLLKDGYEAQSIPPASMRLVYEKIPATVNPGDRLWIYEHRASSTADWEPVYCFTETEFLPRDYEMMNFWTSQSRNSWFTYSILCVRKIMNEQHELSGTLILKDADVKKRIGENTELFKACKTEEERIVVLESMFGVKLANEERNGIRGMVTQLPATASEQT